MTCARKCTNHRYQNWSYMVLMWCGAKLSIPFSVIKVITASWPPEEAFVNTWQPVDNSDINDRQASQRLLVLLGSLSQLHRGLCLCTQFIHHYQTSHRFRLLQGAKANVSSRWGRNWTWGVTSRPKKVVFCCVYCYYQRHNHIATELLATLAAWLWDAMSVGQLFSRKG